MASISTMREMGTSVSSLNPCFSLKRKRPPQIQIPDVLKEIKIDTHFKNNFASSPITDRDDVVSCFGDVWFGVSSVKGKKKFMEDTHKVVSSIDGKPNKGFFGVYDGHGGRKAAEFVAESLHKNILDKLQNCGQSISKEEAIKAAYLKTDREFLEQAVGSGACCVTVLIEGTEMVVSNLGDCRAVLCKGGVAETLTNDHRADREDERKRIEDKGGYIENHKGAWRVHGILSVSRSIGDAHLKDWVVAEPETKILDVTPDMDFLILASDGLWEKVGHQEAIDTVLQSRPMEKKPGLSGNKLLMDDNQKPRSLNEIDDEYHCVSTSSSPKVKRVSLIKQRKLTKLSPSCRKTKDTDILKDGSCYFESENEIESPPTKVRRVSLFQHKNVKIHSPNQENQKPTCGSFLAACRELVNLAVTRGSMDDITVMIVDVNHFKDRKK